MKEKILFFCIAGIILTLLLFSPESKIVGSISQGNLTFCINHPSSLNTSACSNTTPINQLYSCTIGVTDPDHKNFTFSANTTLFVINSSGYFSFIPTEHKTYSFLFQVDDNIGCSNSKSSTIFNLYVEGSKEEDSIRSGGGKIKKPEIFPSCKTQWICGYWSECINGVQTRICYPTGDCEDQSNKPIEKQVCAIKRINFSVISTPEVVLTDESFTIDFELNNIGNSKLENILLNVEQIDGWLSPEKINIGDLDVEETKKISVKFKNQICLENFIVINDLLNINFRITEKDIMKNKTVFIDVLIPKLSIFSDKKEYSEGEMMRSCIISNNINKPKKDKIDIGINLIYCDESYIFDFLPPYSVSENKLLVIIREYIFKNIPLTSDYLLSATEFGRDIFSNKYLIEKANNKIKLNSIIKNKQSLQKNDVFEFRYANKLHKLKLIYFNNDFASIYLNQKNYDLNKFKNQNIDLDGDEINDININYIGVEKNKAKLIIKIMPCERLLKSLKSFEVSLSEKTPTYDWSILSSKWGLSLSKILELQWLKIMLITIIGLNLVGFYLNLKFLFKK